MSEKLLKLRLKDPDRCEQADYWLQYEGIWFEREGAVVTYRERDEIMVEVLLLGRGMDFDRENDDG
ncbi:MAG: hypothetical protein WAN89_03925 [Lawsonella sp.]